MKAMENQTTFNVYFKRFFYGVLLSRISGFGRDLSLALAFGDHPSVAAFLIAFRFSNLIRRLFAEGPFQSTFIPYFEGLRVQEEKKAIFFFRKVHFLLTFFLLIVIVLVETLSFYFFSNTSNPHTLEVVNLIRVLFPSIIFICLYGLNSSICHCFDSFFIPSLAPMFSNIMWMIGAFILKDLNPTEAMPYLALFVVIGFIGQWMITSLIISQKKCGFSKEACSFTLPKEVKTLLKSFSLCALGVGAISINSFIDALFSRYIDMKGPNYLWYSMRMQQLALALLAIACIHTVLPRISRAIKQNDLDTTQKLFFFSVRRIFSFMIPCTFALLAVGPSATALLWGRSSFSLLGISKTTYCLWAYGLSMLSASLTILYSSIFYAHNNFKTPTIASLWSVGINILLNFFFVFYGHFDVASIALATSISSWVNFMFLQKKISLSFPLSSQKILSIICICFFACVTTLLFDQYFLNPTFYPLIYQQKAFFSYVFSEQVGHFFCHATCFIGSLFVFARICLNKEILDAFAVFSLNEKTF